MVLGFFSLFGNVQQDSDLMQLPYLPFILCVDSLLDEVGDTLGDIMMVDDESSDILHSTYAHFLVDMFLAPS